MSKRDIAATLATVPVRIGLAMVVGFSTLLGALFAARPNMMSALMHAVMDLM